MNKQPMTEAEIIEGNKLIAEFMGFKPEPSHSEDTSIPSFYYHSSWDWLMTVVEKIETLNAHFTIGANNSCYINVAKEAEEYEDEWDYFHFFVSTDADPVINKYKTLIEAVWLCVIEFIEWYNQNSKA